MTRSATGLAPASACSRPRWSTSPNTASATSACARLAAALGTSHRMLIYHFQSKEGLLVAVVCRRLRQASAMRLPQLFEQARGEGAA